MQVEKTLKKNESASPKKRNAVKKIGENLFRLRELAKLPQISVPAHVLANLWRQRKIPGYVLGHRSVFFDPQKVLAALERHEVKARK